MSERQYKGKVMVGKVVSDKMQKTVVVVIETRRRHPLYGKIITVRRRFKAHNETPHAKAGDLVKIVEARPLSRTKHWRVAEIVRAGEVVEMIREKELESLLEKERVEKQTRKDEERKRAAERLATLGGFESVDEMSGDQAQASEFEQEYADGDALAETEGDEE